MSAAEFACAERRFVIRARRCAACGVARSLRGAHAVSRYTRHTPSVDATTRSPFGVNPDRSEPITDLLVRWRSGDDSALETLLPLVYDSLRRSAVGQLRGEAAGHTLTPTDVVHEAYLRLRGIDVDWQDRHHFFAVASTAMRRILVEHARRRLTAKRGGVAVAVPFDAMQLPAPTTDERLLALDEALTTLDHIEPRLARVIECRFFLGMTEVDTALALGVTDRTVRRDWLKARGWLKVALDEH
jgi:RNA polymerase sigma factor (TIGR02999 family)